MLERLRIRNFTVFAESDFQFVRGLNVIVGTNGTGKTHVLKLCYVAESARFNISKQFTSDQLKSPIFSSTAWTGILRKSLLDVFLSSQIAPLIRWNAKNEAEVTIYFDANEVLQFELTSAGEDENRATASISTSTASTINVEAFRPVFIPAKEILTLSWMLPGSEQLIAPIEKNYLDLLNQLRLLPLRKPESTQAIQILTDVLGGEVQEKDDKYYLVNSDGRRTAISMLAEGLRKFGTLQKLLANGGLTKNTTLYWDEPEAFRPERFMGDAAKKRKPYTYIPFGGGKRSCIGGAMSQVENTLALSMLLRRFAPEYIGADPAPINATVTLTPRGGLNFKIRTVS